MSEVAVSRGFPSLRLLILIALWGLFVLWTGYGALNDPVFNFSPGPGYRGPPPHAVVEFTLDCWALAAALVVGFLGLNPFRWLNGKRLIIGSMAFAMMLGRLMSGLTVILLQWTQLQLSQIVIAIVAPFVLLLAGAMTITVITLGHG